MSRLSQLSLTGALCLAAACGGQKSKTTADKANGQLRINPSASSFSTESGPEVVCAHFTLQPYIPAADGTPQLAGTPVSFDSTSANANDGSSVTDQILGCIDDGSGNVNWGYIVTVDTFSACNDDGTLGALIPDASPTSTTINVPVHCEAGLDVSVPIQVSIAVSEQSTGGYIDISAGVNATDVQVGCKQADISHTDQLLHFGESYISDDGSTATGLVALDLGGSPTQFGGTVGATPTIDTYYTGDIAPASVNTIYQTFVNPCDGTQEYADTDHAQCVSDHSGTPNGTQAVLADAFAELPGTGFAAISIDSMGELVIYSTVGAGAPITLTPSSPTGYNALYSQTISVTNDPSVAAYTFTGVFVDQTAQLGFLVAATAADSTPVYATLTYDSGSSTWVLGSFYDVTSTVISCNGLYAAPASCFTPSTACIPTDSNGRQSTFQPHPINPITLPSEFLDVTYNGPLTYQVVLSTSGEPATTFPILPPHASRFPNQRPVLSAYSVSVTSSTPGTSCTLAYASGIIVAANHNNALVFCGPSSWKMASGGSEVVDAIAADGTLWTWGNIADGSYGLGIYPGASFPISGSFSPNQIGTDNDWVTVSAGSDGALAIKSDGTLWAWGRNDSGQIGDGTTADVYAPEQIGSDTHWLAVASGAGFSLALKTDGTLWHWGQDYDPSPVLTPTQVGTDTHWTAISAGYFSAALKSDGTLWAWGGADDISSTTNFGTELIPVQVGTDTNWAHIALATDTLLLTKQNGTLWAGGNNESGQVGDGTDGDIVDLEQIGTDTDWAQIGAGDENSGGVKISGALYVWGTNLEGEIGNGTISNDVAVPTLVGSGYAQYFVAGSVNSFAIKTNQAMYSWGTDEWYLLGNGIVTVQTTPSLVP